MPYKKVVKLKCVYKYCSSVEKQLQYTNPVNADPCKELVLQWLRWFAHSCAAFTIENTFYILTD